MAQVKKLQGGGTPVNPVDLFEWEGVGKYERKPMVQTLTKNLTAYADHLGLKGDRRTRFLNNGALAIRALESGLIRRLANGSYEDVSGVMSSTGKYDKNWLGKLKDTDNNAYNDVAGYFDTYMSKASVYDPDKAKKEAEAKKVKFSGDDFLKTGLAKQYYAGTFNTTDWFDKRDDQGRFNAIAEYLGNADYSSIYNKYLWDDTGIDSADALKARATSFIGRLRDGKLTNDDYHTAASLGINLDTFLKKPELEAAEPSTEERSNAAKKAFIDLKVKEEGWDPQLAEELWTLSQKQAARDRESSLQQARDADAQALLDLEWNTWYGLHNNPITNYNRVLSGKDWILKGSAYQNVLKNHYNNLASNLVTDIGSILAGRKKWSDNATGADSEKRALLYLNTIWGVNADGSFGPDVANEGAFWGKDDYGNYLIPGSINENDFTAFTYNPSSRSYQKISLLANKAYEQFARGIWEKYHRKHKEGGVLTMQDGGYISYDDYVRQWANQYNESVRQLLLEQQAVLKALKEEKRLSDGSLRDYVRTADLREAGRKLIGANPTSALWTTQDRIRLATIGADVVSTLAALAPGGGTAISAGLGVGSTLTNFGVDMTDKNVSVGLALGNLGAGLGMDLVGLIPGLGVAGKAGKIAKAIKPLSKGLLWTLRGLGTLLAYKSIGAIQKLVATPDLMTVDDWRDVAEGILAVMGASNVISGKRLTARNTKETPVINIKGADRKDYTISQADYLKLKETKGKEALDRLFNELTGSKKGLTKEIGAKKKLPVVGWGIPYTAYNPGKERIQKTWLDTSGASYWDKKYINLSSRISGAYTKPTRPANTPTSNTTTSVTVYPKRVIRMRGLGEGATRTRVDYLNTIRTAPLTDAEIRTINRNRAAGPTNLSEQEIAHINRSRQAQGKLALSELEIQRINAERAAARAPLNLQLIDAINARAERNSYADPLYTALARRREILETRLDVRRAQLELADATAASRAFTRVESGPVISPQRPVKPLLLLPPGHTISDPTRMLPSPRSTKPAPRRIKIDNVVTKLTPEIVDTRLGINPRSYNGAVVTGPSRASRLADLEAAFNPAVNTITIAPRMSTKEFIDMLHATKKPLVGGARSARLKSLEKLFASPKAVALLKKVNTQQGHKKAAETRKANAAKKEAEKSKRLAEFNARLKLREEKKYNTRSGRLQALNRFFNSPEGLALQLRADRIIHERQLTLRTKNTVSSAQTKRKNEAKKSVKPTKTELRQLANLTKRLNESLGLLKSGGLIPKFKNPASGITQTPATKKNTKGSLQWGTDIWGTDEYINAIKRINRYNAKQYADLNINYAKTKRDTGYQDGMTDLTYNKDVYDRQGKFYVLAPEINSLLASKVGPDKQILAIGETGDNPEGHHLDGYFGTIESGRHFGTKDTLTPEMLAKLNEWLKPNGVKWVLDPGGSGAYIPVPTEDSETLPETDTTKLPDVTETDKTATTATAGKKKTKIGGKDWSLLTEDVLAAARMAMGLDANARAARKQKEGLRPLITDVSEATVNPMYDYFTEREANRQAANLEAFGTRGRTSNYESWFAGALESHNKGSLSRIAATLSSANKWYAEDRLRQLLSDKAKADRVENANGNMGRMLSVDAAKHNIDAALITAQYAQIAAPWMAGIENQYRLNRAILKQMNASAYLKGLLSNMQADYDAAQAKGDVEEMKRITDDYLKKIEDYNKRIYSSPWLILKTMSDPTSSEFVFRAKEGGRLTAREREVIQRARDFNKRMLADNKQFHRDIMESKREHNKLIAGMSSLTADLIKNGMKWK